MYAEVMSALVRGAVRLGGVRGESAASYALGRLPSAMVPHAGVYTVRRKSLTWTLDLSDNIQQRLFITGDYEAPTLAAVAARMRPTDHVLDVGANIGAFALPLAGLVRGQGKVFAVEAAADTADRLRSHVRANGLDGCVDVLNFALSDRVGTAFLKVGDFGEGDVGTRTLEGSSASTGQPTELLPGDMLREQLGVARFDVIKVDVEGHEFSVLKGLSETFAQAPPRLVVLELVDTNQRRSGGSKTDLIEFMAGYGYDGLAIRNRGLRPIELDFSGNALFERR